RARRVDARDVLRQRGYLAGQWPKLGEDARAAHDDAGIGFAHHAQRGTLLEVEHPRDRPAPLQIDERVGQRDVVLADVFVVATDVLAELRTFLREVARGRRPGREGDIHEIGR